MPKEKAGRNIVTQVLQGVIRMPETAAKDITNEVDRLNGAARQALAAA
jgi:ATP-dependent Clp protease adapter protein ClpS